MHKKTTHAVVFLCLAIGSDSVQFFAGMWRCVYRTPNYCLRTAVGQAGSGTDWFFKEREKQISPLNLLLKLRAKTKPLFA
ncbi:MAG: hypothetical protein JWQ69_5342 [Pseudomonas sp.]|nr:hypothetical protein [Pseudomonas sp.]